MLDCREAVAKLGRLLDAELPPQDSSLIEAHIQDCPGCQRELQALQSLSASLEALAAPASPADVLNEVMLRVRGPQNGFHSNWGILEFWKPWPVAMRLSAAGVAATACVIGLMLASATAEQPIQTQRDLAWVELASGSGIVSAYLETAR
jgi:anti-sigma factor RsiW